MNVHWIQERKKRNSTNLLGSSPRPEQYIDTPHTGWRIRWKDMLRGGQWAAVCTPRALIALVLYQETRDDWGSTTRVTRGKTRGAP